MSTETAIETWLTRLRDWWQAHNELGNIDPGEVGRIAEDLGMTADSLRDLAARGPDAADLLYERMRVLGISRADVEQAANGLLRDLERTCACCNEKGICEKDIKRKPDDPQWKNYCPNALSLDSLTKLKRYCEADQAGSSRAFISQS